MSEMIRAAIVRVRRESDQQVVGVGFLVDAGKKTILTCAHVINSAIEDSANQIKPRSLISLDFPFIDPEKFLDARVTHFFPKKRGNTDDIALLEILDDLPAEAKAVQLVAADTYSGHDFGVYGFPVGFEDDGQYVEGKLQEKLVNKRVQAIGTSNLGYFIERGFSGSPVYDKELNAIVGMMMQIDVEPEKRVAFITPLDVISSIVVDVQFEIHFTPDPTSEWAYRLTQTFDPNSKAYSSQFIYLPEISIQMVEAVEMLSYPQTWKDFETERDLSAGAWMGCKSKRLISTLYSIFGPMVLFYWMREFFDRNVSLLTRNARVQYTLLESLVESYRNDAIIAETEPSIDYSPQVPNWRLKRERQPEKYWWQGLSEVRLGESIASFVIADNTGTSKRILQKSEFFDLYEKLYMTGTRTQQRPLGLAANALFRFTPSTRPVYWRLLTIHTMLHNGLLNTLENSVEEPLNTQTARRILQQENSSRFPFVGVPDDFVGHESFETTIDVSLRYIEQFVIPKLIIRTRRPEETM